MIIDSIQMPKAEQTPSPRHTRPVPNGLAHFLKFAAIALAGFIAYKSLTPSTSIPSISNMDKLVHALVYAVLAFSFAAAWHRTSLIFIFLVTLTYGALLEVGQGMMDLGRTASFADQIANSIGAGLGVLAWIILGRIFWERGGERSPSRGMN